MRRLAIILSLLLATTLSVTAQPPPDLDKKDARTEVQKIQAEQARLAAQLEALLKAKGEPPVADKLPVIKTAFKLGYLKPKATFDAGKFRVVVLQNGKTKVVPRFGAYLNFAKRLTAAPLPDNVDYTPKAMASINRIFLNDRFGNCVVASLAHRIGVWTGNDNPGTVVMPTDAEVYARYQRWCGPGDNGCNITDVLDGHKREGMPCGGVVHKIDDYVAIDWTNVAEVKTAIVLFGGGCCLGFDLPNGWFDAKVWSDATATGGIAGGHDVPQFGYNSQGVIISTWGGTRIYEWKAFTSKRYTSEMYCSLSPDWYGQDGIANAIGLDVATLKADLAMLGNGTIPPLPDPDPKPAKIFVAVLDTLLTLPSLYTVAATATGGTAPYTWQIDYGDGTGGQAVKTHQYALAGTYVVTATATDSKGVSGSGTAKVTVSSGPTPPIPGGNRQLTLSGWGAADGSYIVTPAGEHAATIDALQRLIDSLRGGREKMPEIKSK